MPTCGPHSCSELGAVPGQHSCPALAGLCTQDETACACRAPSLARPQPSPAPQMTWQCHRYTAPSPPSASGCKQEGSCLPGRGRGRWGAAWKGAWAAGRRCPCQVERGLQINHREHGASRGDRAHWPGSSLGAGFAADQGLPSLLACVPEKCVLVAAGSGGSGTRERVTLAVAPSPTTASSLQECP